MDHPLLNRAALLLDHGKFDQAIGQLTQFLGEFPDSGPAYFLLSLCELGRKNYDLATRHARQAQGLQPESAMGHYALALVLEQRHHFAEAQAAIEQALALDPVAAFLYARRASILLGREKYREAMVSCNQALALDPEDQEALNLKAITSRHLGRKGATAEQVKAALANDPEDDITHAVAGWHCLDRGDRQQAAVHFQEALRIDPDNEEARQGMLETLRAKNPFYRLVHRFFLWIHRLSSRAGIAVVIGAFVLYRLLKYVAETMPAAAPFAWPLVVAYIVFVLATWYAVPLGNLLLIFHPWGRLALKRRERWGAIITASLLLLALVCACLLFVVENSAAWNVLLDLTFLFGGISIPLAMAFVMSEPAPRFWMFVYAAVAASLGLAALFLDVLSALLFPDATGQNVLAFYAFLAFVVGCAGSSWVAMGLSARTWKK